MIRFGLGLVTGIVLSYALGLAMIAVERRHMHHVDKPTPSNVILAAFR